MTHYSKLSATVIDVPGGAHDRELGFWQAAAGKQLERNDELAEYHGGSWPGHDVFLLVQRLGAGHARVHLDIRTDDVTAEVARLVQAGAERVRHVNYWWVMRDPAGLEFCVVPAEPGALSDENSRRWD